jgi:hypothetical protein
MESVEQQDNSGEDVMSLGTAALEIKLAGGGFDDLYPWELVLDEGFSRLFRAKLTVLSAKKHTAENLAAIVNNGISVIIREKLVGGNVYRVRCLHGIVTAAAVTGVFCGGTKSDCYTYIFTIEPSLALLKFTRFTAPFYKMNPASITEKILEKYNIGVQIKDDYLSRDKFGKNLMFNQSDTSDFDFIDVMTRLYGISFMFTHPIVSSGTLGQANLYLSSGEKFPVSGLAYSAKRSENEILQFDFLGANEDANMWRMRKFHVTNSVGLDGFKVEAMYPDRNCGSTQWKAGKNGTGDRYVTYTGLFHGYEVGTETQEIDDDIKMILDAKTCAANIAKLHITGEAENIAVRPGVVLELHHFYGKTDGAVNTVLVTGIKLRRRALWPADLAVQLDNEDKEISEVQFDGIDWGKSAVKRFCPPA